MARAEWEWEWERELPCELSGRTEPGTASGGRYPRYITAALPSTPPSSTEVLLPSASPELTGTAVATSGAVPSPMTTVSTAGGADTTETHHSLRRRGAATLTGAVGAAAPRMMAPMADATSTKKATKKRKKDSATEQEGEPEKRRSGPRGSRDLLRAGAGKWSEEEDVALSNGVARHGPKVKWGGISNLLPGRTHTECYDRWK